MTVDVQWRADITRQLEASAQSHQATAIILERLKNQMDDHDRRLNLLELAPDKRRQQFSMEGGCLGQVLFACLSGTAVLISIIGVLAQHWKP